MAASKVFISYRREDTAWAARAVFERLRQAFPKDVFIDIETIGLGKKFADVIDQHLEGCNVMLVMIGPRWEESIEERLQGGELALVRTEVTRALAKRPPIPLVPVLIDRRRMPGRNRLPEDLRAVIDFNGVVLEASNFDAQMAQLVNAVRQEIEAVSGVAPAPSSAASLQVPPQPAPARKPFPELEPWMSARGGDAYGRWAEFSVHGVVQRLRWIPPGEFSMGSTEADRQSFRAQLDKASQSFFDDEKPRHRVRLTHGFWLADTVCTQALWQSVVGDNPSQFSGGLELPVEQVSWDDVTDNFLPALSRYLTGAVLALPTEAQWEYACRAGSETAFSFGEVITTDQVNFDGNNPCPGQAKGPYRERTEPVKALPRNDWGLYQMHGNVWEWCADGKRPYGASANPLEDPRGPAEPGATALRALRGGSWISDARSCRSAYRFASRRGTRYDFVGFRLALRSSSPVPAGGA